MSRKHLATLAVLLTVAVCVVARLNQLSLAQPVEAQTARSAEALRWEYSTIMGVGWDNQRKISYVTVGFLTARGKRLETWDGGSDNDPLSVAFARLGAGGWECVGQVEYTHPGVEARPNTWLFKRPIL